ncbi:hypothetical protein JTB14_024362 [Gonioctena quinquepunctata]|nr:hypothetical protein JTB14_024362 [Gonioctena quinquepunctata]
MNIVFLSVNLPFLKQGPSNVKTRETQGLNLLGANHFSVNQPNSQIGINRFPQPPIKDSVFEQVKSQPLTYVFQKLKDEYTRNLVPPPPAPSRFLIEKEKLKTSKFPAQLKDNVATVSEPVIEFHDSALQHFGGKAPQVQDNLVQFSFPFGQHGLLPNPFGYKEQAIDVQVTKEQLKVLHNNQPNRFNQKPLEYVDYDFHSPSSPIQLPKLQTYEVTEGKWVDNPNPYSFNFQQTQVFPQRVKKPTGSTSPQFTHEPIVELNLPPFLPTPYRPPGAPPTYSTQSEASTVFSQVSTKMNKYKDEAMTMNPLFFDLKEVSTHYPILGKPEIENPSVTGENEITTERTKKRRRPQPRRTTTPAPITTTTEEPTTTENYDFRKNQNSLEAPQSEETERPFRRQRPNRIRTGVTGSGSFENEERPTRYRTTPPREAESEERPLRYRTTPQPSEIDNEERPLRYRTTPPPDESDDGGEKRIRGRNRYRQRVPTANRDTNELKQSFHRKRVRTTTEMPMNHKITEEDMPMMSEEDSAPGEEAQGSFESKYPHIREEETTTTKAYRLDYESPNRHHVINQYQEDRNVDNEKEPSDMDNRTGVMIEEVIYKEDVDEKLQDNPKTTTEEPTIEVKLSVTEQDYPSPTVVSEQNEMEDFQTTLATTIPTTTTAETETTKPVRTRGRPVKYNSSNRPRFSVKDYRQRLNQYTSTTPSTTTDFIKTTSEVTRVRFPNRFRSRPTPATTPPSGYQEEESNTEQIRRRFRPKEPRHTSQGTTTESAIISESNVHSVNTKLRPFGRYSNTTKPNSSLFSTRRKALLSMRTNLLDKSRNTEETTTVTNEEPTEVVTHSTTESEKENLPVETSTQFHSDQMNVAEDRTEAVAPTVEVAIDDDDDYSQRVSDLTSSFKTEYETPGRFKSVSPNSRRVPNYFTISTDDPILPIEAFFPNLKEKEN